MDSVSGRGHGRADGATREADVPGQDEPSGPGWSAGGPEAASETLPLRAEELRPRTRRVVVGEVVVSKRVVTERRTIEVEVRREELVVDWLPSEPESDAADASLGSSPGQSARTLDEADTVTILLREEDVRIVKVPVVAEEVRVSKRLVQESQQIAGTVRREDPWVAYAPNRQGDAAGPPPVVEGRR